MAALLPLAGALAAAHTPVAYESTVFSSPHWPACCGTRMPGVYPCMFRIPVTISVGDVVLAFAEGRPGLAQDTVSPCRDGSGRSVWQSRSTSAGRTWDAPRAIANDTDPAHAALHDGVVMGSAVFERRTRTVFLFYTSCYRSCSNPTTLFITSRTLGLTWSSPTNLTSMLVERNVAMMQFGEGLGVQLPSGRLLVCGWPKSHGVVCLSSDDSGGSWRMQGKLVGQVNEVGLALLRNGSVLLNMRSSAGIKARIQSRTDDGGSSFAAPWVVDSLPDPINNGGLTAMPDGVVALTHDATTLSRTNMSLFTSSDGGSSWDAGHVLWVGPAAYSTTTPLGDNLLGVLYERGVKSDVEKIVFAAVPVKSDDGGPALDCRASAEDGPFRFAAVSWSSTCGMRPGWRVPWNASAPQLWNGSDARSYQCVPLRNVVPVVWSNLNASGSMAMCTIDPWAVESGCPGRAPDGNLNYDTSAAGAFPNGTRGQPVGHRVIKVCGDREPLTNGGDWMDAIGPPAALGGGQSACAFKTQAAAMKSCRHCGSDSGKFGCGPRNGSGSGPWKLFCPFAGIWWPRIFAARAQESARFFAKYRSLGGELDELVQDTELGEASWLTAHLIPSPAAGFRDPAACLQERFRLIEEDSRFASDLDALVERGFLPGNTSQPGWLQRSIGTVNPANRTLNQIVFDQFVGERWSQGWSQAYFEPARQVFPAVQMSNYGFSRESVGPVTGSLDPAFCADDRLPCMQRQGAPVGNVNAPVLRDDFITFSSMRQTMTSLRGVVIAASRAEQREFVKPWLIAKSICLHAECGAAGPRADWQLWVEKLLHMGLLADGFLFFNPWWSLAHPALLDDSVLMSAVLDELDAVAGCRARSWIVDCQPRLADSISLDGFLLTGADIGGRRLWRLTMDGTDPAARVAIDGTTGQLTVRGVRFHLELPQPWTCDLRFAKGAVLESQTPRVNATRVGVWITQAAAGATVEVHCPAARVTLTWPLFASEYNASCHRVSV